MRMSNDLRETGSHFLYDCPDVSTPRRANPGLSLQLFRNILQNLQKVYTLIQPLVECHPSDGGIACW
jgi:hypothetical protein